MSTFSDARDELRQARARIDEIERIFALLSTVSDTIASCHGHQPALAYDAGTGRVSCSIEVGAVPPRISGTSKPGRNSKEKVARETMAKTETNADALAGRPAPIKGPWRPGERDRASELARAGLSDAEIACELNRHGKGFHKKMLRVRAGKPAPSPKTVPADPPGAGPDAPRDAAPTAPREAAARLDFYRDPKWPVKSDLHLLRATQRNVSLLAVAVQLRTSLAKVEDRLEKLLPPSATTEERDALIAEVERRAGAKA